MLKRLVGYAAYMFGANVLTGAFGFAVGAMAMVTRSKEAVGDYAAYMVFYQVGQGLFIFGANTAIQRYAADSDENRRGFSATALRLFLLLALATVALGVAVGVAFEWRYALGMFAVPWVVVWWWARYILRSRLDARREANLMMVSSAANSLLQFLLLSFTPWRDAMIYGDFAAQVIAGALAIAYILWSERASLTELLRAKLPDGLLDASVRFGAPVWWSGQIFQAQHQLGKVWTRVELGAASMGVLQVQELMWTFAAKPLEYLGNAALPGLVSAKERRTEMYREILRFCLVAFTFVGIAVATGVTLVFVGIDWASDLFGHQGEATLLKYAEVPALLRILALGMPIVAMETVSNNFAVAEGRPRAVLYSNLVTLAVTLTTLQPLSAAYGLNGILLSGLCGSIVKGVTYTVVLWRDFREDVRAAVWATLQATACCAIALTPSQLLGDRAWSWALAFPAVALYLVGMFAFRLLGRRDFTRVADAYRARRAA